MQPTRATAAALTGIVLTLYIAGCQPAGGIKISVVPADKTLRERTIISESWLTPHKIALLDVSGLLVDQYRNGLLTEGENPVALLAEQLDKAEKDPAVKAVIIRINSPGGTVTASTIMHDEIVRFRKETGKPAVALLMDVAASGGYYVACACDRIVAHRSTVTGSIGVILQLFSLQGTLNKIGVKTFAIKSGPFKDAGSPLRDLRPEERKMFQDIINNFYEQFVQAVATGRPQLSAERVRQIADGRVFTAQEALRLGLIDEIGNFYTALQWVKDRLKVRAVKVVTYHRPLQYKPNIYAAGPVGSGAVQTAPAAIAIGAGTVERLLRPKFLYLWAPGPLETGP